MRVLVLGHRGLVGSAVCHRLLPDPSVELVVDAARLDLRRQDQALAVFEKSGGVDALVLAAAKVGGIKANSTRPLDFIRDNLLIQDNVLSLAAAARIPRLVFLGSACVYPRDAAVPIAEEALLTGPLEPSNSAYAMAKIAGIEFVRAVRAQLGLNWTALMPANLYGPGDNRDLETSHVVPALLRKAHEAKVRGESFQVWGNGPDTARELLYVDDLAEVIARVLRADGLPPLLNVGSGELWPIDELADEVCAVTGALNWMWDGVEGYRGAPRRLLNSSRAHAVLGRWPVTSLVEGLRRTYAWFKEHGAP